ncbi:MAG: M23 family metallopeptidase [Hyphomicrobiales bacterium]|nr:M23 family metallopeptidase [Hyphomicrobiales bacterium]
MVRFINPVDNRFGACGWILICLIVAMIGVAGCVSGSGSGSVSIPATFSGRPDHWHDFDYWLESSHRRHRAHDYAVPVGTPLLAVADGSVTRMTADLSSSGGIILSTRYGDLDVHYVHLGKILVKPGDVIKRGDVIALAGYTGQHRGSRPHLHFEVRRRDVNIDPYPNLWYGGGKPLAFDPTVEYPKDKLLFTHPVAFGPYYQDARRLALEREQQMKPTRREVEIAWQGLFERRTVTATFELARSHSRSFKLALPGSPGDCTGLLPTSENRNAGWSLVCQNGHFATGSDLTTLENGQLIARGKDGKNGSVTIRVK